MQDAKIYSLYAAECRRIAETMGQNERATLLHMAEAWDSCAREAERAKKKTDGQR
jgi:hypothetical protein